jgi:hypothetical protein
MEVDGALGVLDGLGQLIQVEILEAIPDEQALTVIKNEFLTRQTLAFFSVAGGAQDPAIMG